MIYSITASFADTSVSESKIIENYNQLLNPFISDQKVELAIDDIMKVLSELDDKEREVAILSLAKVMKELDGKKLIKQYKIDDKNINAYTSTLNSRLIALGIAFDKQQSGQKSNRLLKSAFVGGLVGVVLSFATLGIGRNGAFTNKNGSQNDLASILIVMFSAGAGAGGTFIYDKISEVFSKSTSVDEFYLVLKEETEALQKIKKVASELE
jgi:hypothetical protein